MNPAEERLAADRANRAAARQLVDSRIAQVKADLAARSVGGRVADKAKSDALDLVDQGLAVAKESKGIIAGAVAALALWTFRDAVFRAASSLFKPAAVQESADTADEIEPFEETAQ